MCQEAKNVSIVDLHNCIINTIKRANDDLSCSSLCLPAISSGIFRFPIDLCAQTILEAIEQELSEPRANLVLAEVRIVIIDTPTFKGFKRIFLDVYPEAKDDSVTLSLPISKPPGHQYLYKEAKEKEPEERMVLEALKAKKKEDEFMGQETSESSMIPCECCKKEIIFDFYK